MVFVVLATTMKKKQCPSINRHTTIDVVPIHLGHSFLESNDGNGIALDDCQMIGVAAHHHCDNTVPRGRSRVLTKRITISLPTAPQWQQWRTKTRRGCRRVAVIVMAWVAGVTAIVMLVDSTYYSSLH